MKICSSALGKFKSKVEHKMSACHGEQKKKIKVVMIARAAKGAVGLELFHSAESKMVNTL